MIKRAVMWLCFVLMAPGSAMGQEGTPAAAPGTPAAVSPGAPATEDPPADHTRPVLRPQWAVTTFGGWLTDDNIAPALQFRATLFGNKIFGVAVSRRQARLWKDSEWGIEAQVVKHFGGSGELAQDHWEFNGLSTGSWNRFPWDGTIDTSFALGGGLSYATAVPAFEAYWKGSSKQLMAYLLFEAVGTLPDHPHWGFVWRVHHRSAAYGLFNKDMKGASNAFTLGLKYMFGSQVPRPRPPSP